MTQKIQILSIAVLLVFAFVTVMLGFNAPKDFPTGVRFAIGEGESLYSISKRLEQERIIGSALLFRGWVSTLGRDKHIDLGVYEFPERVPLGLVIAKIINGPDEPLLLVTVPEGYTTREIATAFRKALPTFSVETFEELVRSEKLDGYLFPSTYYPLPSDTEASIIRLMNTTFEKEYAKHFRTADFPRYAPTRNDVISLAAVLEGEAKTEEDMRIVSGILQKRLEKGMRLQVDVAPNTYKTSGIPEIPINNPGILAIDAVFRPKESSYLYYLTGKDGRMYYAKTYEEHKRNIQKYLR